jgi:hypothetical protein
MFEKFFATSAEVLYLRGEAAGPTPMSAFDP